MRIKFLTSVAGLNYSYAYGAEVEWKDEAEAARYIQSGQAIEVVPPLAAEQSAPASAKSEVATVTRLGRTATVRK